MTTPFFKRDIKSFARRQRQLSVRQKNALAEAWPRFGITNHDELLHFDKVFGSNAQVICEIGFGHGETLISMAEANPDKNYLGIEVHEPGVATVMMEVLARHLQNVRTVQTDAVTVMQNNIADNSLSRVHIYFPDPWPKKRHHKRRLVQTEFIELVRQKLRVGGVVHCATDWEDYAKQMMRVLSENNGFYNDVGDHTYASNEELHLRVNTKFENRGVRLGHEIWDVLFVKK